MREGVDFLRWSCRHHRVIRVMWALCVVAVGIAGLGRALSDDRSSWLNLLFVLGIVGGFACCVMLFRRHEP